MQLCSPALPDSGNSFTTTTCNTVTTGPTGVSSCTPIVASSGNNWTTTNCGTASNIGGGDGLVASSGGAFSCTTTAASAGNSWVTTGCTQTVLSSQVPVASCTPQDASSGNGYVRTTCNTVNTGPTPVASCTAGTDASFVTTTCSTALTGPTAVASCTAGTDGSQVVTSCNTEVTGPTPVATCVPSGSASVAPYLVTTCSTATTGPTDAASCTAGTDGNFVTTSCSSIPGQKVQYRTNTTVTRQLASGGISLDPTTDATTSDTPTDLDSGAAACFMPAGQTAPFWTMSGGLTVDVSTLPPPIPSAVPTARTTLSPVPDSLTLLTNCTQWPCDSNP